MDPNFFIVGAPKAGTTSIHEYLKNHVQVFMSKEKEINFFSSDEILNQGLYYKNEEVPISKKEIITYRGPDVKAIKEFFFRK